MLAFFFAIDGGGARFLFSPTGHRFILQKGGERMNDKQMAFAREYVVDYNATQAAIRAGYSEKSAYSQAHELLKKHEIQEKISELEAKAAKRTEISKDMVLRELARVAFVDPRKLFDENGKPKDLESLDADTAAALASVDILEEYDFDDGNRVLIGHTKKYKWSDKLRALELLGKHLGMFTDKVHVDGSIDTGSDKLAGILAQLKE